MKKHIITLLCLVLLFVSCQNSHHVTHNKRKYNKGYYNPKHKTVKHFDKRVSAKSEEIAKKSNVRKEYSATPQREEAITTKNQIQNTSDQIEDGVNRKSSGERVYPSKTEDKNVSLEQDTLPNLDVDSGKIKKLKLATFFSLLVPTPTFFLGFATDTQILWPIGMLVGALTGLIFAIFYFKKSKENGSQKDKKKAVFAIVLFSLFTVLGIIWLATGFTLDFY